MSGILSSWIGKPARDAEEPQRPAEAAEGADPPQTAANETRVFRRAHSVAGAQAVAAPAAKDDTMDEDEATGSDSSMASDFDDGHLTDAEDLMSTCMGITFFEYLQAMDGLTHFFCEMEPEFIADRFNQTSLPRRVRRFAAALNVLLDRSDYCRLSRVKLDPGSDDSSCGGSSAYSSQSGGSGARRPRRRAPSGSRSRSSASPLSLASWRAIQLQHVEFHGPMDWELEEDAFVLYGALHARYVLTQRGLAQMADKLVTKTFGTCPRVSCSHAGVLPTGVSDQMCQYPVKLYCPNCQDIYDCPESGAFSGPVTPMNPYRQHEVDEPHTHPVMDGAFFTTSLPHMLLLAFPALRRPPRGPTPTLDILAACDTLLVAGRPSRDTRGWADDSQSSSDESSLVSPGPNSLTVAAAVQLAAAFESSNPAVTRDALLRGDGAALDAVARLRASRYVPTLFGFRLRALAELQRAQDQIYCERVSG